MGNSGGGGDGGAAERQRQEAARAQKEAQEKAAEAARQAASAAKQAAIAKAAAEQAAIAKVAAEALYRKNHPLEFLDDKSLLDRNITLNQSHYQFMIDGSRSDPNKYNNPTGYPALSNVPGIKNIDDVNKILKYTDIKRACCARSGPMEDSQVIQLTNLDGTPGEEKTIKNLINLCANLPYPNDQNGAQFLGTPGDNSGNNKCDVFEKTYCKSLRAINNRMVYDEKEALLANNANNQLTKAIKYNDSNDSSSGMDCSCINNPMLLFNLAKVSTTGNNDINSNSIDETNIYHADARCGGYSYKLYNTLLAQSKITSYSPVFCLNDDSVNGVGGNVNMTSSNNTVVQNCGNNDNNNNKNNNTIQPTTQAPTKPMDKYIALYMPIYKKNEKYFKIGGAVFVAFIVIFIIYKLSKSNDKINEL